LNNFWRCAYPAFSTGRALLLDKTGTLTEGRPKVAEVIPAGTDPTGAMSSGHIEILYQIHRLSRLLEEVPTAGPDEVAMMEVRRLLHCLRAILRCTSLKKRKAVFR
jgi:hypothetical protein